MIIVQYKEQSPEINFPVLNALRRIKHYGTIFFLMLLIIENKTDTKKSQCNTLESEKRFLKRYDPFVPKSVERSTEARFEVI